MKKKVYCFVVYTFNKAACWNVNALHVSVEHLLAQKWYQSRARNPLANDSHSLSCSAATKKKEAQTQVRGGRPSQPPPHPPTYLAATTQIRAQAQWPRPSAPTRIP